MRSSDVYPGRGIADDQVVVEVSVEDGLDVVLISAFVHSPFKMIQSFTSDERRPLKPGREVGLKGRAGA